MGPMDGRPVCVALSSAGNSPGFSFFGTGKDGRLSLGEN